MKHEDCGPMNNRVVLYPTRAIGNFAGPIVSAGASNNHSILLDSLGYWTKSY